MNSGLRTLRNIVVVLGIMVGTAALTVWFIVWRDRRLAQEAPRTGVSDFTPRMPEPKSVSPERVPSLDGDLNWSRDEILTLRRHIGNRTILALLELLRERDGAPVNYNELMDRTGRTMPQVRADLAVFSRAVKKVEGHQHWPIAITDPTDDASKIAYTAPKRYLDWWFED